MLAEWLLWDRKNILTYDPRQIQGTEVAKDKKWR